MEVVEGVEGMIIKILNRETIEKKEHILLEDKEDEVEVSQDPSTNSEYNWVVIQMETSYIQSRSHKALELNP